MRSFRVSVVVLLALAVMSPSVFAGGSNVYPNGAEGFWTGAVPPPGMYYINYDLWYSSHKFAGNNDDEITAGPLGPFKTDVLAQVSRFLYVSKHQVLGGQWGAHIFIVYQDVNTRTALGKSHVSNLGDTIIDPFVLSWHWPNFHMATGVDIFLPTGSFEAGRVANTSANVFVFEPIVAVTWNTPLKGFNASAKFMYDIPTKNDDFKNPFTGAKGGLLPGQEFHFDYSLDYTINQNLKAGLEGYYYIQTTNDRFRGSDVPNNKGMVFAAGPGIEYSKGRCIVSFKTEFEMTAKNRPEGIANWLRVVYVF